MISRWSAHCPPARSPSSSPTSKARRGSCTRSARSATPTRSPSTGASCAPRSRAHGGVEVDTQGDAFFVAFPTAPGALAAAAAATEELAAGPIRVRMGIHSGTPLLTDEGYVGVDVHRAARIAACGHGGQILVSAATAGLVDADGLHDLGEHRLKDLSAPERIYQLGDAEFPPLKSLYRTNLPVPATPFLGRERRARRGRRAARARASRAC